MRLLIDIGNTYTKWMTADDSWQLCDGGTLVGAGWGEIVERYEVRQAVVCASGNKTPHMKSLAAAGVDVVTVGGEMPLPLTMDYATPETLGPDRVAAACGAWSMGRGSYVVIDAGTCVTVDYIDGHGFYRGGAILPGPEMQLAAMHGHTARLPQVEIPYEELIHPLGRTTGEALLAGAVCGVRYAVHGFVEHYRRKDRSVRVIYTGGDGIFVCGDLPEADYVPDLVFRGLAAIGNNLTFQQTK